ncbi:ABC-2 type transport system ATP-binding protein [Butyrivibrio fibrisolvens DSM 3071]|uniref:ABC-2 type transport system ATP-binding protein n=1 Tax=Butyrivibrio fibrisolvens DSM 3071 TaxID=1121131 RepID=A0A1M5WLF3_BUTFI|nr:ABC transporter ATP-binding protein [Butyrivibrio fibrisolvens]SHH88385.1 ABC-2 type transport system ATP-binding protein [Butyrivibrio fibrisolvens DSM 3071]
MIEVDNIVKTYGDYQAVNHLSFKLEKGKIYGFLGPNGAGKSTTMNIMTGYIAADSGTVTINGHDILKEPEEAKACVGYLPEIPPLYMDMTVGEYLRFVCELKKVPKKDIREHLVKILSETMLGDYEHRMIRNLSKGYKQRVGLAQALVGDPEVIILDEPTVGLDPQQINQMQDFMRSLKKDHIVILSSHILSQVSAVCDYILIMSHGELVQQGSEEELEAAENKSQVLKLRLIAEPSAIKETLKNIAHVKDIQISEKCDGDKAYEVVITTDAPVDVRKNVGLAFAKASIPVLELTEKRTTLEDIFLAATTQTPGYIDHSKAKKEKKNEKEEKEIEEQRKEARRIAKEVAKAQGLDPLRPESEEEVLSDEELEKAAMGELDIEDIDEVMAETDEEENE